jgi:hypothetical protein
MLLVDDRLDYYMGLLDTSHSVGLSHAYGEDKGEHSSMRSWTHTNDPPRQENDRSTFIGEKL